MAYMHVSHDQPDAILYLMLVGTAWQDHFTGEKHKEWDLFIYRNEEGRKQGLGNQTRHNPYVDVIFLELPLSEMIKRGRLTPIVPLPERQSRAKEVAEFRRTGGAH
ncbi:MAG: hypothetical protein WC551_07985 [Patescibacteria group bacterium]